MIKKILLSLFLFVGLGISYTFGYGTYVEFGNSITQFGGNECTIGNNLSFNCSKAGLSLTSYDSGYYKTVTSFFRTDNGLGFYYKSDNGTSTRQGLINTGFYICSGDTSSINVGSSIIAGGCSNGFTKVPIGSYEDFINFLKGKIPRLVGSGYPNIYPVIFELIYDNFYFSISLSPGNNNFGILGVDNYVLQDMGVSGSGFNLSFSNIIYSPYGGSINGGSNTSDNVLLTGNLLYNKCTNGYVISQIDSLFGNSFRNSCYAGGYDTGLIDQYSSGFVYHVGYGMDFKQLYNLTNNGQSWNNWFNSNLDSMQRYKLGKFGDTNPFMGSPVVLYTYFDILYDKLGIFPNDPLVSSYDVLNYCQLMLYSDLIEEYKGQYFKSYCDNLNYSNGGGNINTGEIGDIDDDEILPPGFDNGGSSVTSSGSIVSVDWSGTLSGNNNQNFDGKNFINNFYQKLQSVFQKPIGNAVGIIPSYILVFMFALILFRFLSH